MYNACNCSCSRRVAELEESGIQPYFSWITLMPLDLLMRRFLKENCILNYSPPQELQEHSEDICVLLSNHNKGSVLDSTNSGVCLLTNSTCCLETSRIDWTISKCLIPCSWSSVQAWLGGTIFLTWNVYSPLWKRCSGSCKRHKYHIS